MTPAELSPDRLAELVAADRLLTDNRRAPAAPPAELSGAEYDALAVRIIGLLDGLPLGTALKLVTGRVPYLLNESHRVRAADPEVQERIAREVSG